MCFWSKRCLSGKFVKDINNFKNSSVTWDENFGNKEIIAIKHPEEKLDQGRGWYKSDCKNLLIMYL